MNFMILLIFCSLFYYAQNINDFEFTNITCSAALEYVEVHVCAKKGRQVSVDVSFLKPVSNFKANIKFFLKRNNKRSEIFKAPPIEWCKMVDGKSQATSFQKLLIKSIQISSPKFIHPCPYEGRHSILNATAPKDVVEIVPTGLFEVRLRFFDKVENNILSINVSADVFKLS
ncbi:hypothetical protein ACKWTF_003801 [Chironomus riparius]